MRHHPVGAFSKCDVKDLGKFGVRAGLSSNPPSASPLPAAANTRGCDALWTIGMAKRLATCRVGGGEGGEGKGGKGRGGREGGEGKGGKGRGGREGGEGKGGGGGGGEGGEGGEWSLCAEMKYLKKYDLLPTVCARAPEEVRFVAHRLCSNVMHWKKRSLLLEICAQSLFSNVKHRKKYDLLPTVCAPEQEASQEVRLVANSLCSNVQRCKKHAVLPAVCARM